jgi:DNA-directed RNA polymerase subunit D
MEIKVIEKKKDSLSFVLKDSTPAYANMLRKTIIDEIPVMAIEDVEIRKNSSVLYDEMIAHRLGLVPLKTDLKNYTPISECKCEGAGCAKCTVKLTLKAKGPCTVYASEMKSNDPAVKAVYETPIVKLLKNQELEFEATAVLGKGKEHSKWSAGLAYYKYKPEVEVVKNPDDAEKYSNICPLGIIEVKSKKLSVNKAKMESCHLCGNCTEVLPECIKLNENNKEFIFYIESWGQLDTKQMLAKAVELVDEQLDELKEKLK